MEIHKATSNFDSLFGTGGIGLSYKGVVNDLPVVVKVLHEASLIDLTCLVTITIQKFTAEESV